MTPRLKAIKQVSFVLFRQYFLKSLHNPQSSWTTVSKPLHEYRDWLYNVLYTSCDQYKVRIPKQNIYYKDVLDLDSRDSYSSWKLLYPGHWTKSGEYDEKKCVFCFLTRHISVQICQFNSPYKGFQYIHLGRPRPNYIQGTHPSGNNPAFYRHSRLVTVLSIAGFSTSIFEFWFASDIAHSLNEWQDIQNSYYVSLSFISYLVSLEDVWFNTRGWEATLRSAVRDKPENDRQFP